MRGQTKIGKKKGSREREIHREVEENEEGSIRKGSVRRREMTMGKKRGRFRERGNGGELRKGECVRQMVGEGRGCKVRQVVIVR